MRYHVENFTLLTEDGEYLLGGPLTELCQMVTVLNAADPPNDRLAGTLRALLGMTRDCSFAPGERMLNDATPMIDLRKRRPEC
jgi:hypothetical protein